MRAAGAMETGRGRAQDEPQSYLPPSVCAGLVLAGVLLLGCYLAAAWLLLGC